MEHWKKNLYTVWAIQILSLSGFSFGLPFLPFYIQELGITEPDKIKVWTGLMASLPGLTMGIMAPVWGMAADRFGRKLMLIRATLSGTIIIGAMGLVVHPESLLVLRIIQGLFTGTVSASATLVAAETPRNRSGYALGFLSSSTFIGQSLGPLAGGLAAEQLGYRYSFFIGSAILFVALLLCLFLVRELRAEESESEEHPSSNSGGETASLRKLIFSLLPLMAILYFLRIGRTMPSSFLPLRVQEIRGMLEGSSLTMGYLSAGAGIATAFAGIIMGRLGDRGHKLHLITLCALGACLLEIPLSLSRGLILFALFYVLLSFTAGGIEPQLQALISSRTPANKRGLLFGLQTTVGSLGWASAPMIGSWISINHSFSAIFLFAGGFFIFAAITGGIIMVRQK